MGWAHSWVMQTERLHKNWKGYLALDGSTYTQQEYSNIQINHQVGHTDAAVGWMMLRWVYT
jgi:hypothetical protein